MSRSRRRSRKADLAGLGKRPPGIVAKTPDEIEAMAAAGALLSQVHDRLNAEAVAGVSTIALDAIAEEMIRAEGATPAFKGYRGFPGTITSSINEQVVHAIPGPYELRDGDIASLDCGLHLDGWVADSARTVAIGEIDDEARRLMQVTHDSLLAGIAAARPGNCVGDIGHAVQSVVEEAGFAVVRSLVGHGVGKEMHEEPQVPNFGTPGKGPGLIPGTVIAIEPMVNVGTPEVVMAADGWTVSSADGSMSAHFEHTVAVTDDGPRILTGSHPTS